MNARSEETNSRQAAKTPRFFRQTIDSSLGATPASAQPHPHSRRVLPATSTSAFPIRSSLIFASSLRVMLFPLRAEPSDQECSEGRHHVNSHAKLAQTAGISAQIAYTTSDFCALRCMLDIASAAPSFCRPWSQNAVPLWHGTKHLCRDWAANCLWRPSRSLAGVM